MPSRSAIAVFALLAPPSLMLGACAGTRNPDFEVVAVRELERSEEAVVLGFTLAVSNPNDEVIPLRRASYDLILAGRPVFSGARSAETILRRFDDTQTIELPAVIPADAFDLDRLDETGELRYLLTGSIEYLTPGELAEVLFDVGLRRPRAPISARGTIDLAPTPEPPLTPPG